MDKTITLTQTADGFAMTTPNASTTASDLEMALEYAADYFNADVAPTDVPPTPAAVTTPENGQSEDTSAPSETPSEDTATPTEDTL